jgi:hypothetical protein
MLSGRGRPSGIGGWLARTCQLEVGVRYDPGLKSKRLTTKGPYIIGFGAVYVSNCSVFVVGARGDESHGHLPPPRRLPTTQEMKDSISLCFRVQSPPLETIKS